MTKHKHDRSMLCAAVLVHEHLAEQPIQDVFRCPPEYSWTEAMQLRRQIVRAQERGWRLAAARLIQDLDASLHCCQRAIEAALHTIEQADSNQQISSAAEIYKDIRALKQEFDEVEINLAEHEICVATDHITLEGIHLGRFQIRLDWQNLGEPQPYQVSALEPNPAASDEGITHPHVRDKALCEGEGRVAIRTALAQGRIYEFFLLVSQILHTYGHASPYTSLDSWDNDVSCDDCGTYVREGDRYDCVRCGSTLCGECSRGCAGCEDSHCSSCLFECPECGQEFCRSCMETCSSCHSRVCHQCLENGVCTSCREKQNQNEEKNCDDNENQTATEDDAATTAQTEEVTVTIEPNCLGKTLVPA